MGLLQPGIWVHMVGIGGIGLSAIARVLHGWGYQVSGSDQQASPLTEALASEGIAIYHGHKPSNVPIAEDLSATSMSKAGVLVVVSSAVPDDNPEVIEARRRGLPVLKRRQLLAELTANKTSIAVAGTHGKTTTSAMIAWILTQAGLDPTFIVGGVLQNLGTNARAGAGSIFVIEADEYDRTFLGLQPEVAVITTVEHDHPDCYPTFEEMREAFARFAEQVVDGGLLVLCGEDREARQLRYREDARLQVQTYGFDGGWDWSARGVNLGNHAAFEVLHQGKELGACALQIPGSHNVLNALAAMAASMAVGADFGTATAALTRFRGTARRFEIKGQAAGVTVVDDYAHHPTEIQATLAAARLKYPGRPVWAVFQPHTYSRTAALLDGFAAAFGDADHVLVTDVYAAREQEMQGVTSSDVVARMRHRDVHYVGTREAAVAHLMNRVQAGEVVITLGAGDGYLIGEDVLANLKNGEGKE